MSTTQLLRTYLGRSVGVTIAIKSIINQGLDLLFKNVQYFRGLQRHL